jgi:hypothetical protein
MAHHGEEGFCAGKPYRSGEAQLTARHSGAVTDLSIARLKRFHRCVIMAKRHKNCEPEHLLPLGMPYGDAPRPAYRLAHGKPTRLTMEQACIFPEHPLDRA